MELLQERIFSIILVVTVTLTGKFIFIPWHFIALALKSVSERGCICAHNLVRCQMNREITMQKIFIDYADWC